ncbi:MAG: hypothetical protein IPP14_13585 [Planctomycetes bacterium]|nr:hypothetical protein [Planctomycetota bacterium]
MQPKPWPTNLYFSFAILVLVLAAPALLSQDVVALRKEFTAKRNALAANDVPARRELAKWCIARKLRQSELAIYREILSLDPKDEAAHKGLSHVKEGESWFESIEALQAAKGRVRGLNAWLDAAPEAAVPLHEHLLTPAEFTKIEAGEALAAHKGTGWQEVLTLEWRIRSGLTLKDTLELARMMEQAVRTWRTEGDFKRDANNPITLHMEILKSHEAYVAMIEGDIETYEPELAKSHGFFDGQTCWGSYFKDWYRTRRIVLHEGRHQFDMLIAKTFGAMPAWYREGLAEFYSIHDWDGKTLQMGRLNSDINEHLYFLQRICKRKKLRGAAETIQQGQEGAIDPEFYQQTWAFIYYCRTGPQAEAFKKWEAELLAGKLPTAEKQLEAFKEKVAPDLKDFDSSYNQATNAWASKYQK